ncbi:MAG: hypothetical protein LBU90_10220 [Bacteroidales bacterium]|jgi:hypothetical protein|nr:hypothetical protein [Bacteroidales bacterium]
MLYVVEIKVPNRSQFGGVFQIEQILPAAIYSIDGACCNVILDPLTKLQKENTAVKIVQTGTVSVSLNNSTVIVAGARAVSLADMPTSNSLTKNIGSTIFRVEAYRDYREKTRLQF